MNVGKKTVVTQSMITSEINELKESLATQDLVIPSFFKMLLPGLLLFVWFIFCPWFVYGIVGISNDERVVAIGAGVVIGFMLFIVTSNLMNQYLVFPESFRRNSNVMKLLRRKGLFYYTLLVVGVFFLTILSCFLDWDAFSFAAPLMLSICFFSFLVNLDLGRYQLTALLAVIHEFKNNNSKN